MPAFPHGQCLSCDAALLQPHGFYGTDLCGPCCCGEAALLGKVTYHCTDCALCDEVPSSAPAPACKQCKKSMVLDGVPISERRGRHAVHP